MREWLRDMLGINKYVLVWDFNHCGAYLHGRNDCRHLGWLTKREARRLARQMDAAYGVANGHWIERVEV